MNNMKKKLVAAAALSLVGCAVVLAPAAVWAGNERDTIKIQDCIKESGAPQFLSCHDLESLDIR